MKFSAFLKDRALLLLLHVTCMAALAGFLHSTGYAAANITLICIFWLLILGIWLTAAYLHRKKYFEEAADILEHMDKPYLLGEVLPDSYRLEDKLYREMLRKSNKSVIEEIHALEDASQDYREYLESWVHEIKAPITGISLLCENMRGALSGNITGSQQTNSPARDAQKTAMQPQTASDFPSPQTADDSSGHQTAGTSSELQTITRAINTTLRNISLENSKIENYADMVLYYARSGQVHKDYLIRETDLQEIVYEVLEKERFLLIQNHVQADVSCPDKVFTDKKWISFILHQLVLNSVKYCSAAPVFRFYTRYDKNSVTLLTEDNGTGILPEDLPRIFEKGFTGNNGRNHEKATGMGLYLCKKLCDSLGISLSAQSEYGRGTQMKLVFPKSSYNLNPFYNVP